MGKVCISGPNENSQKASISVNVLAAKRQDEIYERTTINNNPDKVSKKGEGPKEHTG